MINLLLASLTLLNYVSAPVTDMREHPKQDSEIVSQAYFSEQVHIVTESDDWVKIETVADHYQGWTLKKALCQRPDSFLSNPANIAKVNRRAAHFYELQDTVYGPALTLPFDSQLEVLEGKPESDSRWLKVGLVDGRQGYMQRGDVSFNQTLLNVDQICSLSLQFLGLPYTWGGRSSFGYDCSGFVQMLYRQMGIYLPRDSKDQIRWEGFNATPLENLTAGDLIFFGLAEDKIRHVGLYLGDDKFIHATVAENAPYIHISSISAPDWNGSGRLAYRAARTLKK